MQAEDIQRILTQANQSPLSAQLEDRALDTPTYLTVRRKRIIPLDWQKAFYWAVFTIGAIEILRKLAALAL
jgi:hypothetical protein